MHRGPVGKGLMAVSLTARTRAVEKGRLRSVYRLFDVERGHSCDG